MTGAAFAALVAGAGVRSSIGVLMLPLQKEFGWSSATIGGAAAVSIALIGLSGPFAAALMQRFGVRRIVAASLLINAAAVAATTFVREPWQFIVLMGLCVGVGTGLTSNVLAAIVATRWFVASRGVVVGLLSAGFSTGQLVFLPALAAITASLGWREALWFIAACAAAVAVPAALLIREYPSDLGLPPNGLHELVAPPATAGNPITRAFTELGQALGARDFRLLFGTFFVCGASTSGLLSTHFIAACGDHGVGAVQAAGFLAAMGVLDLLGTTFSGYLSDRFDSRILLAWYYALRGLSLLLLPQALAAAGPYVWLFTLFYGLDWIATVPPTIKLTTAAFGTERGPVVYGWVFAGHQLGASAAALFGGVTRTALGSYDPAFWTAGALCLAAAVLSLFIGRGAVLRSAPVRA